MRAAGVAIKGGSDHTVTQSLYLFDPNDNEIELFIDGPAVDWQAEPAAILSPVVPLDRSRWLG
ncbi:MAG: hypothetical protein QF598_07080 [Arenicellales bacterium]|nr:hypothetical protein [Arenicellales bacterium]MDP6948361.1 hypothetical protein [Arenicellales bacterium]